MNNYLVAIMFFLPAGVANLSPIFANKLPYLKSWEAPLDFGKTWRGKRIFGQNKRIRGVLFGTIMGGLTAVVVAKIFPETVITIAPFWTGCILGIGALLGDAFESFFKRQLSRAPGQSWFPFDQTDYIIGGLLLILPFVNLQPSYIAIIFVVYFGLHLSTAYLAYLLDLKDQPI